MAENESTNLGSVFWIVMISLAMIGLIYLGIWAYIESNLKAGMTALIYSIMILFSVVITRFSIFSEPGSWGKNCFWVSAGILLYIFLLNIGDFASSFAMTDTYLLSTLYPEMPMMLNTVLKTLIVPIAEEALWILAMPVVLFYILDMIGNKYKLFKNKLLQLLIIVAITSVTFFLFHVGNVRLAFALPAISFRTLTVLFVYGDQKLNVFKMLDVIPAFAIGCHIGNNLVVEGIQKTIAVYSTSVVGYLVMGFFVLIILSAINYIVGFFIKKGNAV